MYEDQLAKHLHKCNAKAQPRPVRDCIWDYKCSVNLFMVVKLYPTYTLSRGCHSGTIIGDLDFDQNDFD